jgi:hypothetical protein
MTEFDSTAEGTDAATDEENESFSSRSKGLWNATVKRAVLFISFGPGVLGFLWLIGRILKR